MPDELQQLLANPGRAITLTQLDDSTFGQYPAYFRKRIKALAEALASGKITVDEWLIAMRGEIDDLHHAAYMVGSGKQHQLDEKDLTIIAAIVAAQFAFLVNWAKQLQGAQEFKASSIESRADLYLNSANATIQKAQTAAIGMPELPAYPGDGQSQCLVRCLCHWEIHKIAGEGNWDCVWVLGQPETVHCENCPKRAQVWNPLRIRQNVIENYDEAGLFAAH